MNTKHQLTEAVLGTLDNFIRENLDEQVKVAVLSCIQSLELTLQFHELHPELVTEKDALRALQYLQVYKKHALEITRTVSDSARTRRLESLL